MAEDSSLQEFESNPERFIHVVRDQQVILDYDLAWLYGVETKVFNQAVKRTSKGSLIDSAFSSPPRSSTT